MTSITDNPAVQQLASLFDLESPPSHRMVVTDWHFVVGQIHIISADVYDTKNNFVKKADLSLLQHNMHLYSFVFKKK